MIKLGDHVDCSSKKKKKNKSHAKTQLDWFWVLFFKNILLFLQ